MKKLLSLTLVTILSACVTTDYTAISDQTGINKAVLIENCKNIHCMQDELKGVFQTTASDKSFLMGFAGDETRTISFSWQSGINKIYVDLYHNELFDEWLFLNKAEIYINKELVAEINGDVKRTVGNYNQAIRKHEKIERISGTLNIEDARKIANSDHNNVTIRFYNKTKYVEKVLPRSHNLINVINIAGS